MDSSFAEQTSVGIGPDCANSDKSNKFDLIGATTAGNRLANLTNLSYKLLNGFDSFERHAVAASYIQACRCRRVLDIGGWRGKLNHFLSGSEIAIDLANISGDVDIIYDGHTLPCEDNSYDAVISLDVMEHVPPKQRDQFVSELLRVSKRHVMISAPYQTDLHAQYEKRLFELYLEATGGEHHFLKEHIANGLVHEGDLREILSAPGKPETTCQFYFAGNLVEQARPIELMLRLRADNRLTYLLNWPFITIAKMGLTTRLGLSPTSKPETNRIYAVITKN